MIHINRVDLKKLERLGSGDFGIVYKKDENTAYKIYHLTIANMQGIGITNPSLTLSRNHFYSLINRSKKLKYSGGINDLIYVDGKFGGVCIPYYDGKKLDSFSNESFKVKISLAKQMVRNCKELSKHLIYPTDIKFSNIIVSNNEIKLIDLDDNRTHIGYAPNPLFEAASIYSLGKTIQYLLNMDMHKCVTSKIAKDLKREHFFFPLCYKRITNYIKNCEKEKNIIFIDEQTDLSKLKEILSNHNFETVYVLNNNIPEEKLPEIISFFKKNNIYLYDFIDKNKIDTYQEVENINESYILDKELKKTK